MTKPSKRLSQELTAGVTLARFADMTELSSTTIRNYEVRSLVTKPENARYGMVQFEQMERIKELKAQGLSLQEIETRMTAEPNEAPSPQTVKNTSIETKKELSAEQIEDLRVRLEKIRNKLLETKLRINKIQQAKSGKVLRKHNELVLSQTELAQQENLKQQELQRALRVERKLGQLRYAAVKPTFLKLDTKTKKV